jgi:hypothetical protein
VRLDPGIVLEAAEQAWQPGSPAKAADTEHTQSHAGILVARGSRQRESRPDRMQK